MTAETYLKATLAGGVEPMTEDEVSSYLEVKRQMAEAALVVEALSARNQRNELLTASDWTELPSAAQRLTSETLAQWASYRQNLRDIPQQSGFPLSVTWPEQPA